MPEPDGTQQHAHFTGSYLQTYIPQYVEIPEKLVDVLHIHHQGLIFCL